jgi:hypothetical protein
VNKILSTPAAAAISLLILLGPAQALGSPSAATQAHVQAHRAANPSAVAKAALRKGVRKIDGYHAKHRGYPSDKLGIRLVQANSPAGILVTYRAVGGHRPGYCAATVPTVKGSKKLWFHDSYLHKTWRASRKQVVSAGGACAAVAHADSPYANDEMKTAVDDANAVVDAIDNYGGRDDVDSAPTTIDAAFLAANGVTLKPGSNVVGYDLYDPEDWDLRFCLVRDSGAWATYDEAYPGIVGQGTSGAACTY